MGLDAVLRQRLREAVSEARRREVGAEEAGLEVEIRRPDLIHLRQRFGLSRLRLAGELGVSQWHVRDAEIHGKADVTVADYRRAIERLGLEPVGDLRRNLPDSGSHSSVPLTGDRPGDASPHSARALSAREKLEVDLMARRAAREVGVPTGITVGGLSFAE